MEHRLLEPAGDDNDNYTAIAVKFEAEGNAMHHNSAPSAPRAGALPVNRTALMRLGLIAILLIAMAALAFRVWHRLHALQQQVDTLTQTNQMQEQKLGGLQNQLQECQKKTGAGSG